MSDSIFGDSYNIKNREFPEQGKFYTVEYADNLQKISRWAYGYDKVIEIIRANSALLQPRIDSGRIHEDLGGIPIVYKNDRLWIPILEEQSTTDIEDVNPEFHNEIVFRINGKIFHGFTTNTMERSINTIADSFSFTAPYDYNDESSKYLDAYTFHEVELFIDGKLFMTGTASTWSFKVGVDSTMVTIGCKSKAGVLVDCPSNDSKLNYTKQTFSQIAQSLIQPYGITLELPYGDSGIINRTKRDVGQKIFDFLAKIAKDKGFILNSTSQGGIKLDRANIDNEPILNIIQGDPNIIDISVSYDGQKRFSSFKAISQSRGNAKNASEIKDTTINAYRPNIFNAENNEQGGIQNAALWERSRSLARSSTVSVMMSGWDDKNGDIITENNTVTLYAPSACIHTETKYLIEKVSYAQNGKSVTLSLTLPQAYTLEFPEKDEMPWQR
jgi:prophage tail gpP-like protein